MAPARVELLPTRTCWQMTTHKRAWLACATRAHAHSRKWWNVRQDDPITSLISRLVWLIGWSITTARVLVWTELLLIYIWLYLRVFVAAYMMDRSPPTPPYTSLDVGRPCVIHNYPGLQVYIWTPCIYHDTNPIKRVISERRPQCSTMLSAVFIHACGYEVCIIFFSSIVS